MPRWRATYGQLVALIFYNIAEKLAIGLEARNLNDAKSRRTMQQQVATLGRVWFVTGPRYGAGALHALIPGIAR